jgi:hypothetical protein
MRNKKVRVFAFLFYVSLLISKLLISATCNGTGSF